MRRMAKATRRCLTRACVVVALTIAIAGCATQDRQTFDFDGSDPSSRALPIRSAAAVGVGEPTASGPVAGDRVVVRQSDDSLAVLPGVQWSDRLPMLFQRRVIDRLERAGVPALRNGGAAAYRLQTDLRRVEIDVARDLAVVEVAVRLVSDANDKERAAAILVANYPAPEHTGAAGVRALSEAADEAARKIAQWTRPRL